MHTVPRALPPQPAYVGLGVELRCHSCSHFVGYARTEMQLAGVFNPSLFPNVARVSGEVRRVCRSCRFVNVFVPLAPDRFARVEVKG